jgi:hypothetical protein
MSVRLPLTPYCSNLYLSCIYAVFSGTGLTYGIYGACRFWVQGGTCYLWGQVGGGGCSLALTASEFNDLCYLIQVLQYFDIFNVKRNSSIINNIH